ncbi:MAG: alpha/beta hydrolase domain-containing protein, partial [Dehalococcoidia bacterium]
AAPPSQHPRIADGTAVSPETVLKTLETIPGVKAPAHLRRFTRLDFGPNPDVPTNIPPKIGGLYPNLVSAVDGDGNETSGIRMPYITVPLATYTGWNLRHSGIGGGGEIMSTGGSSGGTLKGSTIPFPATAEERQAAGDPRLSVEERYGSKEGYLSKIEEAAQGMVDEGYLLSEDVATVMEHAGQLYEAFAGRVAEVQAADN